MFYDNEEVTIMYNGNGNFKFYFYNKYTLERKKISTPALRSFHFDIDIFSLFLTIHAYTSCPKIYYNGNIKGPITLDTYWIITDATHSNFVCLN